MAWLGAYLVDHNALERLREAPTGQVDRRARAVLACEAVEAVAKNLRFRLLTIAPFFPGVKSGRPDREVAESDERPLSKERPVEVRRHRLQRQPFDALEDVEVVHDGGGVVVVHEVLLDRHASSVADGWERTRKFVGGDLLLPEDAKESLMSCTVSVPKSDGLRGIKDNPIWYVCVMPLSD